MIIRFGVLFKIEAVLKRIQYLRQIPNDGRAKLSVSEGGKFKFLMQSIKKISVSEKNMTAQFCNLRSKVFLSRIIHRAAKLCFTQSKQTK